MRYVILESRTARKRTLLLRHRMISMEKSYAKRGVEGMLAWTGTYTLNLRRI